MSHPAKQCAVFDDQQQDVVLRKSIMFNYLLTLSKENSMTRDTDAEKGNIRSEAFLAPPYWRSLREPHTRNALVTWRRPAIGILAAAPSRHHELPLSPYACSPLGCRVPARGGGE